MRKLKLLTVITAMAMVITTALPIVSYKDMFGTTVMAEENAQKIATKGQCGDNATYSYDTKKKTLTISGTGAMWDYTEFAKNFLDTTKIVIKKGITVIGKFAFDCLEEVKKVEMANTVYAIKESAFGHIRGTITIPASVKKVEKYAINGADKIVVKGNMKNYGYAAFGEWVHHVEIGGTAETLGYAMILADGDSEEVVEAGKCVKVTVSKTNKKCKIENHCLMSKKGKILYYYIENGRSRNKIVIPDTVETISPFAFIYANVKTVKLGKNVRTIGEYAFKYSYLQKVIMNTKLKTIKQGAFTGDYRYLKRVTLKSNVNMAPYTFDYRTKIYTTKGFKKAKTTIYDASVGSDENMDIKFCKVAGAQGYQVKIQRGDKIFTYTMKKNKHSIKKPAILQNYYVNYELWDDKEKVSENSAYVTVRPYKVLKNNKKVYGKWSSKEAIVKY